MILDAIGSALVGLLTAWAALRLLPLLFPSRRSAVLTGLTGALLGGLITRWVVGPGVPAAALLAALFVAAAGLSLLVRAPGTSRSHGPRTA